MHLWCRRRKRKQESRREVKVCKMRRWLGGRKEGDCGFFSLIKTFNKFFIPWLISHFKERKGRKVFNTKYTGLMHFSSQKTYLSLCHFSSKWKGGKRSRLKTKCDDFGGDGDQPQSPKAHTPHATTDSTSSKESTGVLRAQKAPLVVKVRDLNHSLWGQRDG